MQMDADIVIAGAGPAGLSTWLHLHRHAPELAKRSLLIEKAVHPRDKLCGGGVTLMGDLTLAALGIAVECPSMSIDRVEIRFASERRVLQQPGAVRVVRRSEFDATLAKAARDRGAELREGTELLGLERRGEVLCVQTSAGDLAVRTVVGADGAQSVVRRAAGFVDTSPLARLIEVVRPVDPGTDAEFSTATAVFDFTPLEVGVQGYVWHFPCLVDGVPCVNRGIYDSRLHPERHRADLRTVFEDALAKAGQSTDSADWQSHPIRWFGPPGIIAVPNVLLAGDAAGVDPLLGEGIAPSLAYGDLAARLLMDAFSRRDFSFRDLASRAAGHPLPPFLVHRGAIANGVYSGRVPPAEAMRMIARALLGPPA